MKRFLFSLLFLGATLCAEEAQDPYRWLEDASTAQKEWIAEQATSTERYFSQIKERPLIKKRLTEIAEFEEQSLPEVREDVLYYFKQRKGENKSVLIQKINGLENVLFDPNQAKEEINLIGFSLSPDGKYLAYGVALSGSDQNVWHLYDVQKQKLLLETFEDIQFSRIEWDKSNTSLYYISNCNKLFRHKVGTPLSDDELLYTVSEGMMLL